LEDCVPLTGRYDFRKTWGGKIVLRVEEEVPGFWRRSKKGQLKKRWRDANLMDLTARELRVLMDSRLRPLLMAQYGAPVPGAKAAAEPEASAAEAPSAPAAAPPLPAVGAVASIEVLRKSRTSPQAER